MSVPLQRKRHWTNLRRPNSGFALLEAILAFTILAITLTAIFVGISVATRSDQRAQSNLAALALAQAKIEAVGVTEPLVAGQRGGQLGARLTWREAIKEVSVSVNVPDPAGDRSSEASPPNSLRTFWVSVVVDSADGSRTQLGALKVSPRVPR